MNAIAGAGVAEMGTPLQFSDMDYRFGYAGTI